MPDAPPRRGGQRPGAGRPAKFGEPTRAIRVPQRWIPSIKRWLAEHHPAPPRQGDTVHRPVLAPSPLELLLYAARVPAGFPSPADDDVEGRLDLNQHLIRHPAATFFVRVSGESMLGAGIHPGDLLVVDRALEPAHGKVVIAVVNGELTVKRLCIRDGQVRLLAENERYAPIVLSGDMDLQIWGVVTNVIHPL
ncbi:translesion error-prone DNA polymerase V autoproteolytic subunit [Candidatus Competibacter phosphatis]|uniref:Translesion error-prone DNA polymerase V autoproteolytic subunit n=1 Tax=Candidatus Competibacter phosphatis TaxID=221280 RepID=A0ABX1THP0_9GAMM|nr:translesion error-prone DNA polymerase V autoproteolytic subunit [Candidatus Competibacter phosphatis]NMQ18897.1 translesion error-prone DNA polymerase V autoproteolytic subunit [Candidatus Competibacter phosphatis]